ncbi:MAG: DUF5696 domain-containing protein [Eubacteriales bacterium]
MKKSALRLIILFLTLIIIAPSVLSVVSFAAENSEATGGNDWSALDPAYTAAEFNTVGERILGNDVISPMKLVLTGYGYALYNDPATGEVICLKLKQPDENGEYSRTDGVYDYTGYYCTNPYLLGQSVSTDGKSSSLSVKKTLLSQLLVKFTENTTATTLESYANSALFNQITVKAIRGGLRVEYTIGREETTYLVPRLIRFEKWMDLLVQIAETSTTPKDKKVFMAYYVIKAISPEQLSPWLDGFDKDSVTAGTLEYLFMTRKEFNSRYKGTQSSNAFGVLAGVYSNYVEDTQTKSRKTIEETQKLYPCTSSFAVMLFEGSAKAAEIRKVEQIVKLNTSYTKEQLAEDHAETDYIASDKIPALFKMAIEYTLNENGLYIRLNAGNIRFDSSNYTLDNISVLPYAGAASVYNEGYIFSPDGSGTIFDLKSLAGTQFTTTNSIYGQDYAYHSIVGANKEVVRFPAFGAVEAITTSEEYIDYETILNEEGEEETIEVIKTKDTRHKYGYLAVITSGDSLSKITIANGGALHMFAYAYTMFNPRPSDTYVLDGGISAGTDAMWTVESKRRYTGDFGIQIFMLDEETASYAGMANAYRDYLVQTGALTKLEEDASADIPLYIKTLGALETTKTVFGVPVITTVPLTSFDKTVEMLQKLKQSGIDNVKVLMEGWCNKGMWPLVPSGIELCDALGGKAGWNRLMKYVNDSANGTVSLYPDLEFMLAYRDEMFDGFSPSDDLAKTIDDRGASYKIYDSIFQGYWRTGDGIMSSNVIEKFYNKTYADYSKLNVGGIAVSSMGALLSSDFNEDDPLNREDSRKIVTRLLKKIREQNGKVLVAAGNSYTLPYVTDIVDVPLDDSRYKYTVASVPFYGMVLHSYVEFTGTAINLAGDYRYQLLKTIENGASPQFVIAIENTAELKQYANDSVLGAYYSVKYSIWLADMVNTYKELNAALKGVKHSSIINHEFIDDDRRVVMVTYDNDTVFLINYLRNDYEFVYGGEKLLVKANDFLVTTVKEGGAANG